MITEERFFCRSEDLRQMVLAGVALKKSNTLILCKKIWGATDHDGGTVHYKSNDRSLSLLFLF
ncbi:hypothetical protein KHA97_09185 [Bacillus sp. FJAT-49870]|uniref:Uncharacterized protein n=1 Tax=Lederbergia citri TaxID=2833580 RepID=A0A942YFN3_9BACI|nr:hypothetical protein [Lederbergia citri]